MSQLPKALADLERDLTLLLLEVRGTEIAERARLYVEKFAAGRALSEYMHDESMPVKERAALAGNLKTILRDRDYERLPPFESGAYQARDGVLMIKGAVITGLPCSVPPVFNGVHVAGAPNPVESQQRPPLPVPIVRVDEESEPVEFAEMQLTPEAVRKIVREELAACLACISKVLRE